MGNLVIRNQRTNDKDVTEFQACWRNLGAKVKSVPHWLHPSHSVIGRTNVLARVINGAGVKTGVAIVYGGGYLNYRQGAQFSVKVYNPRGQVLSFESDIPAFTHQLLWLDEIFPDLSDFLTDGFGTCFVRSHDADFNCQLVTTYQDRSVSLQHLWGY